MKSPLTASSPRLLFAVGWALSLLLQGGGRPAAASRPVPATCSYNTWVWDTRARQSVNHERVSKPYSQITTEEKDPHSSCTVCEEDQEAIEVEGMAPIYICKDYAGAVRQILNTLNVAGFPVRSIEAYRPGRSKGPVDARGLRTQFSNHSFGTAIDFNSEINGLYTDCFAFGPGCHLLRGGVWNPAQPGTITKDSVIYRAFMQIGWKWGGELVGRQKDFMHFSLLGD